MYGSTLDGIEGSVSDRAAAAARAGAAGAAAAQAAVAEAEVEGAAAAELAVGVRVWMYAGDAGYGREAWEARAVTKVNGKSFRVEGVGQLVRRDDEGDFGRRRGRLVRRASAAGAEREGSCWS